MGSTVSRILIADDERDLVKMLLKVDKLTPPSPSIWPEKSLRSWKLLSRIQGIGIPPEDLDRVFGPFHRGKNATGEDGGGLGLSLVKEVVELHGGKVLVQSEPPKGSTFSILLPFGEKRKGKEVERELTKT